MQQMSVISALHIFVLAQVARLLILKRMNIQNFQVLWKTFILIKNMKSCMLKHKAVTDLKFLKQFYLDYLEI